MLDTNILIDAYDSAREWHSEVKTLVDNSITAGHEIYVATLSCKDAYFVLGRICGEPAARRSVQNVFLTMELLPVDSKTTYEGFHSTEPDFEDGIIRACAELNHIDFLVTRDERAFKGIKTQKVTPVQMLAICGELTSLWSLRSLRGSESADWDGGYGQTLDTS
jgi:predicted nucleic acid-binding protein